MTEYWSYHFQENWHLMRNYFRWKAKEIWRMGIHYWSYVTIFWFGSPFPESNISALKACDRSLCAAKTSAHSLIVSHWNLSLTFSSFTCHMWKRRPLRLDQIRYTWNIHMELESIAWKNLNQDTLTICLHNFGWRSKKSPDSSGFILEYCYYQKSLNYLVQRILGRTSQPLFIFTSVFNPCTQT